MFNAVKTISIKNPRVIEQVNRMRPQAGRSMTEAAENLILDGIERRLAEDSTLPVIARARLSRVKTAMYTNAQPLPA